MQTFAVWTLVILLLSSIGLAEQAEGAEHQKGRGRPRQGRATGCADGDHLAGWAEGDDGDEPDGQKWGVED